MTKLKQLAVIFVILFGFFYCLGLNGFRQSDLEEFKKGFPGFVTNFSKKHDYQNKIRET
ncbi:hypothetical protein ACQCT6_09075 [Cytobacillus gottheilii]